MTDDRLRAGARYIEVVTLGAVAWLLIDFAAWGLFAGRIEADPGSAVALLYFALQVLVPLVGALTAGIGFQPEVRIRLGGDRLSVERGDDRLELPADDILAAETMNAVEYHRGPRLLKSTRPYINSPVDRVLAITTPDGLVVLGVQAADLETLAAALQPSGRRSSRPDREPESQPLPAS